ncbi:Na+/H+ antiporter subunit A [Williamsia sp. CHRR-6]|uniref:Na+/H+ antiporter subunit A n=1 Tax=Williamsia sp. CHRR-6 TaxID=2835871 RepID=UPI001BDAE11C|nr:Na+/H+ antiporter subunit A [Williamsia sp. CHRR-6]MBT0567020.1 Na+/H+ antiporter subunit A [Williamsia sp. CHRR-6]
MFAILIVLTIAAAAAPAIVTAVGPRGFYLLALAPAGCTVAVIADWPAGDSAHTQRVSWVPALGMDIDLRMDTLAAVMSVLVLGVGALVLCYCAEYFVPAEGRSNIVRRRVAGFAGEMVAFTAAMFGLVVSDNMIVLYVFWEATSVLSFLLVGFYAVRATSRRAATQALLVTTAGGLAMLVGIVIVGERAGTYRLSDVIADPPQSSAVSVAIVLILIGALSKSAIVPFHFWLPGAMAAPTPVSAYLHAAAMVKAGIFLVARLAPGYAGLTEWRFTLVALGVATMVLGGWRSLRELDLKLILAFGTVSQLGLLMLLVGVGDANLALAGITMLVAHALFKAALFMVVGIIDSSTGTRDIRRLARLGVTAPGLATIAVVAGASMAGLPITLGFVGKEGALAALLDTGALDPAPRAAVVAGVVVGSTLTVAYTVRFLWGAFGRKVRTEPSSAVARMQAPSLLFCLPAAIPAVLGVLAAALAGPFGHLVEPYAQTLPAHGRELEHLSLWHGFTPALGLTALVIVGGVSLFAFLRNRRRRLGFIAPALGNADRIYDAVLRGADTMSLLVTRTTQTGSLPITQGLVLSTAVLFPSVALLVGSRDTLRINGFESFSQVTIGICMVAAALTAPVLRNRLAATVVVGVTGYGCGVIFALYGAPDLALTQFLVETLSLVVFVLVLRRLPAEVGPGHSTGHRGIRALIGIGFGVMLVIIGLFAAAARSTVGVAVDLPAAAKEIGNGANTVNVILVDIRAWDTLGEISVLLVAATGVASMIFRHKRFGTAPRVADVAPDTDDEPMPTARTTWLRGSELRDPRHRSMVLEATTRLIFPTMVVLSIYFFFAGHNAPGGGFAGGLTMGMALVLRYLAGGRYELGEALPVDAGKVLGAGLALSVGTAVVSLFLGAPALSSAVLSVHLPVLGDIKLVTALFFDLGVYLIVVGLVLDVLRSLGARLDAEEMPGAQPAAHPTEVGR